MTGSLSIAGKEGFSKAAHAVMNEDSYVGDRFSRDFTDFFVTKALLKF
jgi:hypothetical protein